MRGSWVAGPLLGPLALLRDAPITAISILGLILLLTLITQVGGPLLWVSLPLLIRSTRLWRHSILSISMPLLMFASIYLIVCFFLVPPLAAAFGRVPLPCTLAESATLQPQSRFYCLTNRHYVIPSLKQLLLELGDDVARTFPGSKTIYLDTGFPFLDGFPLLPHLSHHDGRKADLAFFYRNKSTGKAASPPSPIGYWIYEAPKPGEAQPCRMAGLSLRWDFDWLQPFFTEFEVDPKRTRWLLSWLVENQSRHGISRILIEPHLETRLGIASKMIKFQGCRAARHDDHLHIQVR